MTNDTFAASGFEPTRPRGRRRYPSDLTDQQWRALERLLRDALPRRRCRIAVRDVANAVSYRWWTGCSWRMLPHDFPPPSTVYGHLRAWNEHGILRDVRNVLLARRDSDSRLSRLTDRERDRFAARRAFARPSPAD